MNSYEAIEELKKRYPEALYVRVSTYHMSFVPRADQKLSGENGPRYGVLVSHTSRPDLESESYISFLDAIENIKDNRIEDINKKIAELEAARAELIDDVA